MPRLNQIHAAILDKIPATPGVYLHKDAAGRVLYVGKAKSLRNRVRSYFQPSSDHPPHIAAMMRQVADVDVFQTHTEAEALILEANLIKKHLPRYNINLKDDKSYPFFKLTVGEMYPRLYLVREKLEKNAEYYGPYASMKDARETLDLIRRHYKLRTSKMKLDGSKTYRPCINFQLRKCIAPCRGTVQVEAYRQNVNKVRLFFQGRGKELLARLDSEMKEHAQARRYEEAARVRDAIHATQRTLQKQQVVVPDLKADQDVFGLYRESHFAGVQILFIRHGRLIGSDFISWERTEGMADEEIIRSLLRSMYTRPSALLPKDALIPCGYEDREIMESFLSREKGSRVRITTPSRGPKRKLIDMARDNARLALKERMSRYVDDETVLEEARRSLHLTRLPRRVEAFDISNIAGTHTAASMVVWENNQPVRQDYRKFKIRSVRGPDDFLAMYEVLMRRYRRAVSGEQPLPDLILIDGGKGQVNIAQQVLEALGISQTQVDLIGLAKGRAEKRRGPRMERLEDIEYVVKAHIKNELRLRKNSAALHFLQRIRDESHRFAISYHRNLRRRQTIRTELEAIPGLGSRRAQALLRHFGSLKRIQEAELEELQAMPGLPRKLAGVIHEAYHLALAEDDGAPAPLTA
ncbi:MAG: excinuclease ABC subunit UvrC [SAR324 cluster bacterium]|nr:excinuclease ABC subunit UvrC [SAR324 cluster bacterium]